MSCVNDSEREALFRTIGMPRSVFGDRSALSPLISFKVIALIVFPFSNSLLYHNPERTIQTTNLISHVRLNMRMEPFCHRIYSEAASQNPRTARAPIIFVEK